MLRSLLISNALSLLVCFSGVVSAAESLVAPGAKVEKIAGGMKFTEGPVWLPKHRKLVFSDIPNSKLMQWTEADGLALFRESQQANGNIIDSFGRIISCQHAARNVIRIDEDGRETVLVDRYGGKRLNSPNDAALRSDGTLWFTDPAWGLVGEHEIQGHWVYKLDLDTGNIVPVIEDLAMPNGIVFSPDESRLYVADTGGHPRHPNQKFHDLPPVIRCYEVNAQGELGAMLFKIDAGSDGMTVDANGNLFTTHDGKVIVYSKDGVELEQIEVPEGPANVCFGGADYKTLFITARTSLYRVQMRTGGVIPKS